jgi:large subunit ribosomal protein L13
MLPKNRIAAHMLKKLRVFSGATHTHEANSPQKISV